jgi:hypothetical protein
MAEPNLFADVQHRSFVALAFADHDLSAHWNGVHYFAHSFDGHVIGVFTIALPHSLRGSDPSGFDYAQKIEPQLVLHLSFTHMNPPVFVLTGSKLIKGT